MDNEIDSRLLIKAKSIAANIFKEIEYVDELKIREEIFDYSSMIFGELDRDTIIAEKAFACALRGYENKQALEHLKNAYENCEKSIGDQDELFFEICSSLVEMYIDIRNYADALSLQNKLKELFGIKFGEDHYRTIEACAVIAYIKAVETEEIELWADEFRIIKEAYLILVRKYGDIHPSSLAVMERFFDLQSIIKSSYTYTNIFLDQALYRILLESEEIQLEDDVKNYYHNHIENARYLIDELYDCDIVKNSKIIFDIFVKAYGENNARCIEKGRDLYGDFRVYYSNGTALELKTIRWLYEKYKLRYGEKDYKTIRIKELLVETLGRAGKHDEAIIELKNEYCESVKENGDCAEETIKQGIALLDAYSRAELYENAYSLAIDIGEKVERFFGDNDDLMSCISDRVPDILLGLKRYEDASLMFEKMCSDSENTKQTNGLYGLIRIKREKADERIRTKNYDDALDLFVDISKLYSQMDDDFFRFDGEIDTQTRIAEVLEQMDRKEQALVVRRAIYNKRMRRLIKNEYSCEDEVLDALEELARLLYELGEIHEAILRQEVVVYGRYKTFGFWTVENSFDRLVDYYHKADDRKKIDILSYNKALSPEKNDYMKLYILCYLRPMYAKWRYGDKNWLIL